MLHLVISSGRLLLMAAALFCAGCASTYEVSVQATSRIAGVSRGGTSFVIHDPNRAALGELRTAEIGNALRTALSAHGLHEAADSKTADLVVEITYGIDPAKVSRVEHQEFVFGRPVMPSDRLGPPPEGVARELMGYSETIATEFTREKHVSICGRGGRAIAEEQPGEDFWRVHVVIANDSDDLRGHLPVLISAAMDFIGRTTDGEVTLAMRDDDSAIQFVQRGL